MPPVKAVIFDIGGVVLKSPFIAIAQYEKDHGLPANYLNCSIAERGSEGAWQKFERGELPLLKFYEEFGKDLSDTVNGNLWYADYCQRHRQTCPSLPLKLKVDGRDLFGRMMRNGATYDVHILKAIHAIRASKRYRVIALTNNFSKTSDSEPISPVELAFLGWDAEGVAPVALRALFDDFCDSSVLGLRKPDPEFYLVACRRNNIDPHEAVFLDDIGANLKAARQLGMQTIQVQIGHTLDAVKTLESILELDLTGPASVKL